MPPGYCLLTSYVLFSNPLQQVKKEKQDKIDTEKRTKEAAKKKMVDDAASAKKMADDAAAAAKKLFDHFKKSSNDATMKKSEDAVQHMVSSGTAGGALLTLSGLLELR